MALCEGIPSDDITRQGQGQQMAGGGTTWLYMKLRCGAVGGRAPPPLPGTVMDHRSASSPLSAALVVVGPSSLERSTFWGDEKTAGSMRQEAP